MKCKIRDLALIVQPSIAENLSWGAIREADGMPVLTIWADEIAEAESSL